MSQIVNNIWLVQNLACLLIIWIICNLTIRFSKYVIMVICLVKVIVNESFL